MAAIVAANAVILTNNNISYINNCCMGRDNNRFLINMKIFFWD